MFSKAEEDSVKGAVVVVVLEVVVLGVVEVDVDVEVEVELETVVVTMLLVHRRVDIPKSTMVQKKTNQITPLFKRIKSSR